jgi:hypothetical protein
MVSARLVHQIEDHWEAISSRLIQRIHRVPELTHLQRLPDSDLREAARRILGNLGEWMVAAREQDFAERYERNGRQRCDDDLPLCEAVRAMQLMREETQNYVCDQGFAQSSVDVYAEGEMGHQLAHFFDLIEFHLIRGYEARLREKHQAAARAHASAV